MTRASSPFKRAAAWGVVAVLALLGAGCGDKPETPPQAVQEAGPGPQELVQRLFQRTLSGTALSDESWGQDVDFLRRLLWPDMSIPAQAQAAKTHAAACHVAGDIARTIAQDPGARGGLEQRDAVSLALHDGWLKAAQAGLPAYRAWCEGPGHDLLKRLEAERARLFEGPGGGR